MTQLQKNSHGIRLWLKLKGAQGIGSVTFQKLLKHFGSVENAMGASVSQLMKVDGVSSKTAEQIAATRDNFDSDGEIALAEKLGVVILSIEDERYPAVLKRIYSPPAVIYVKGTITKSDNLGIAIVGSRRCSLYGQEQAGRFAHLLASAGFTICSGLARGVDSAAHQGALSAGGRTLAVLGCGLANIFPPENKKLSELICENGACISELPLQAEPLSENFPPRNRIIAGLSLGTIVIEAALRSGALLTAKAALENDREVMAIPGKIDSPLSKGSNQLIKDGARLVDCIEDVLDALGHLGDKLKPHAVESAEIATEEIEMPLFDASQIKMSEAEKMLYDSLDREPIHLEQIISCVDLAPGNINAGLVSLQLKGLVKQLPGNMFKRR